MMGAGVVAAFPSRLRGGPGVGASAASWADRPTPNPSRKREGG